MENYLRERTTQGSNLPEQELALKTDIRLHCLSGDRTMDLTSLTLSLPNK